jgi:S1-C subfamily serine protease
MNVNLTLNLSVDMVADLAVITIDANQLKLPYLNLGDSDRIRAGEHCIAVGSPLTLSNTVTAGIVSNIGRTSSELGLYGHDINYIQTDCMITSGNSGGPLVNLDGQVIGINSMKVMTGISFSLPINYAKHFLADIEKKKSNLLISNALPPTEKQRQRVRYLGIQMFSLTPQIVEEMRYRMPMMLSISKGVYIAFVMPNSNAQSAGLRPGDIIIQVNGNDIETCADLIKYVQNEEKLNLKVVRNNGLVFNLTVFHGMSSSS